MNNEELERRSHAKDLGITISDDLKFHKHTQNICNKTKGEIGRIRRSFVTRTPCFLTNLYKTYVRPHLEFCSTVWNPVYQMDIDRIEKVQDKFTRLLKYSRVMTPAERNSYLNISTHQERREGWPNWNIQTHRQWKFIPNENFGKAKPLENHTNTVMQNEP